jgi:hypothetical protein
MAIGDDLGPGLPLMAPPAPTNGGGPPEERVAINSGGEPYLADGNTKHGRAMGSGRYHPVRAFY